jgi:hypothetical protein
MHACMHACSKNRTDGAGAAAVQQSISKSPFIMHDGCLSWVDLQCGKPWLSPEFDSELI